MKPISYRCHRFVPEIITRPSAPSDQRTKSTYIFGAICPARGVGAGASRGHSDA
jgi:hypothetical protein